AGTPGEVAEPAEPGVSDLGGGSDFAPFSAHLGIPSVNHGFASPGGVYHSAYDTWRWMAEHGDPGFSHHALSSRLVALLALRLADAEVIPYDVAALARQMAGQWDLLRSEAREAGLPDAAAAKRLDAAWSALERAGEGWDAARRRYLAGEVDAARSRRANEALRSALRATVRPQGLTGRPWYRSLLFAPDDRDGYATLALPSIAEAIRAGDRARLAREIDDLAGRIRLAAGRVEEAEASLER
ncbi:MAG: transferrin receptor-like dimerization domain-containing protein, partial [Gemmatimonadota bacterium]|nr:transferrin receptor-like dimerization domain-containing protein [Gemmatimonadota bacterium]